MEGKKIWEYVVILIDFIEFFEDSEIFYICEINV